MFERFTTSRNPAAASATTVDESPRRPPRSGKEVMDMSQDPVRTGGSAEPEVAIPRNSRLRRTIVLVLVSLGLVSGGALISATAAGAASGSSETATVQDSSSDSTAEQAQEEEGQDGGRHDCPREEEGEESA
jgi:hypothetical protein